MPFHFIDSFWSAELHRIRFDPTPSIIFRRCRSHDFVMETTQGISMKPFFYLIVIHRVVRPELGHWNRPHRYGVCLHKRILLTPMRKTVSHTGLTCPVNFPDQQPLGLGLQHDGR